MEGSPRKLKKTDSDGCDDQPTEGGAPQDGVREKIEVFNVVERRLVCELTKTYTWQDGIPAVGLRFEKEIDALRAAVDCNLKCLHEVLLFFRFAFFFDIKSSPSC